MNYFTSGVDTIQIIMNIRNELYASIGYYQIPEDLSTLKLTNPDALLSIEILYKFKET